MAHARVKGVSVFRPIIYGNTSVLLSDPERAVLDPLCVDHTHRWTIAVRSAASPPNANKMMPAEQMGGADDLGYYIKKVTFKLYETYSSPLRSIEAPPFEVTETGWGEFDIIIKIFFVPEANEKPITLMHHLKLHPWPTAPTSPPAPLPPPGEDPPPLSEEQANLLTLESAAIVHSWQYDELIFSEPTETFYSLLMSAPPTALPPKNRHPGKPRLGVGGNIGEFNSEMEKEEADRLDKAKAETLVRIEELKADLAAKEKEATALKKELEERSVSVQPEGGRQRQRSTPAS